MEIFDRSDFDELTTLNGNGMIQDLLCIRTVTYQLLPLHVQIDMMTDKLMGGINLSTTLSCS